MGHLCLLHMQLLAGVFLAISSELSSLNVLCFSSPTLQCHSYSNCTLKNVYRAWPDRSTCNAASVVYPTTELELLDAVAGAVQRDQSVKVITHGSYSIPKWACPRGSSGLFISTRDYTSHVIVDRRAMTVTADSGVRINQLVDTIAAAGLALPHSTYWAGVTLGGLLSTGCHGSSLFGLGSAVHEYVVSMRLVVPASAQEGYAKVIVLTERDEQLNAAKVSLGVLGVISQVTLALQPQFKRSVTKQIESDADLENRIVAFGKDHEFGDVNWYPSQYRVVFGVDSRVPVETVGDGKNDFTGFRALPAFIPKGIRAAEEAAEAIGSTKAKCLIAALLTAILLGPANGLKNKNQFFTQYPVIGFQNRIQTAGSCNVGSNAALVCPWDSGIKGFFFHETTLAIPLENISDFIVDVKQLRDLDPSSLCGLNFYAGMLMRFVKGSTAYLGHPKDAVDIDIAYYRANGADVPRLKEDVMEEIEQIALFKYGAVPHWGKNRPMVFDGVKKKYPKISEFLAVKESFDPKGIFSSEWSDAVLGVDGRVTSGENYCALEGLCICSEDRHCAPEKGYYCRPGKVYTKARVCRSEGAIMNAEELLPNVIGETKRVSVGWLRDGIAAFTATALKLKALIVCNVPNFLLQNHAYTHNSTFCP